MTVYLTVPDTMMDLAITREQHDRMVDHCGHPLTWKPDHTVWARCWGRDKHSKGQQMSQTFRAKAR